MKVLILGGAGFVGANLVRHELFNYDSQITVVDSLDPHFHSSPESLKEVWDQIQFIQGDIRDEKLIREVVQNQDIIFNCAAQSSHTLAHQFPMMDTEINCLGNLKLLEAVRLYNPEAVVLFTSSSTVIGRAQREIVDERHPEVPLGVYSANKGIAEKYYQTYARMYGLKTVVLRFANLYGPFGKGRPEFCFLNYFIHQASEGREIQIYGSGKQIRNIMYIDDATEILSLAVREPKTYGELFFATSPYHEPLLKIAELIIEVFGKGHLTHIEWPADRYRIEVGDAFFSAEKIRNLTGWAAQFDPVSGLKKTKDMLENYYRRISL